MLKKLGIAVVCAALLVAAMAAMGFSLERGGSGWPRFVTRSNVDALEENRAAQRSSFAPGGATEDKPAFVSGDATANTAAEGAPTAPVAPAAATAPEAPAAPEAPVAPVAPVAPTAPVESSWPEFRGARRDGRYTATTVRASWPREGLRPLWKQPVGGGYASFVTAGGRAFTIEQRRNQEIAAAYDIKTGRELWTNGWTANFQESMGGDGPRATPTYHDGRVYVLGAEGELRVLDAASGRQIWRKNILQDANAYNLSWGMSASPLIVDGNVIVLPGGTRGQSVVAYDKGTGARVWAALNDEASYTSPMIVTLGGVRQILVVTATRIVGLVPENGRLLWEFPWRTFNGINVAQPIVFQHEGRDRIFLSASYGQGAALLEIANAGGQLRATRLWENQRMKNKFTSSVLHDGHIYGLDESILASINAATGEQNWKGGRYGYGQLVLAGDKLVVLSEDGDLVLVNATPARHEELARFAAIEGKSWNHPALDAGTLLVRNIQEMAAFDLR